MLKLVDFQSKHTESGTVYTYGIYNTENDALYYYTESELLRVIRKQGLKIKGLNLTLSKDSISSKVLYYLDGITFIQEDFTGKCFPSDRNSLYVNEQTGHKEHIHVYYLETIFTKPMKIAKFSSGSRFWYKGLRFEWKRADKGKRSEGFNLETTIPWKETKNRFYTNRHMIPCVTNDDFFERNWPKYMTNDIFKAVLNEFQTYYVLTGFYRSQVPFCKNLSLRGVNTQNITSLRNCFWHNNTLEEVDLANLDLGKITDFYYIFTEDTNLKTVYFNKCKGDLQITGRNLCALSRYSKDICFVISKKQPLLGKCLQEYGLAFLGTYTNEKEYLKLKDKALIHSNLLNGKKKGYFFVIND